MSACHAKWPATRKLDRSELEFSGVFSLGWEERKTMKASKFSDAQKAFSLKQGNDGVPVADICRKAGISQATYFNWKRSTMACSRRRCAGLSSLRTSRQTRRVCRCESQPEEACRGLVAGSRDAPGRDTAKTVRPARKRELASTVCDDWGVSIRRARSVLEFDRSTYHYKSRRREQAGVEARIEEICQTRVR